MYEFICEVSLEKESNSIISTWASTVLEAFDNLVLMDDVFDIKKVTNKSTGQEHFFTGDATLLFILRKMRKEITTQDFRMRIILKMLITYQRRQYEYANMWKMCGALAFIFMQQQKMLTNGLMMNGQTGKGCAHVFKSSTRRTAKS